MTDAAEPRHYRFAPRDRTGWLFGLDATQCIALGAGTLCSGTFLDHGLPVVFTMVPVLAALVFSFARWSGTVLHDQFPVYLRWLAVQAFHLDRWNAAEHSPLPPFLSDFEITDAQAPPWLVRIDNGGIGVVLDRRDHTVSATLPVRAKHFSLCESQEQDRLLAGWGDALSAFATERATVRRIVWTERAAPANSDTSVHVLGAILHEASVTIAIDLRRVSGQGAKHTTADDVTTGVLAEELRLLTLRLEDAGLDVDVPLSAEELHQSIAARLDPEPGQRSTGRTLAQMAGLEQPRTGPKTALLDWNWIRVDHSVHHTYWFAEWPRLDVRADWLEPLLLNGGGTRTFSVIAEPISPSRSRRQIERDATKLATDERQRSNAGFRIGADHERASSAVLEREDELTAGYSEFTYVGLFTVTAPDVATLRTSCLEYEQVAAHCGIRLESLDARHDLGLVCTLPLGRGPATRRLS